MNKISVITIDGPSASGKGSLAKNIANHFDYDLLDSGILYRLFAMLESKQKDFFEIINIIKHQVEFELANEGLRIMLDQKIDITHDLRSEEIAKSASQLSSKKEVRELLFGLQRDFYDGSGLVADGRDMGTKVFSKADMKFYLTASVEKRAERRLNQLKDQGISANLPNLIQRLLSRDKADTERLISPLMPATDAIIIDTSDINASEVFNITINKIRETLKII